MTAATSAAAFAIGLAWLVATCGARLLWPGHVEWLMQGDASWHELGWLYYGRDAWHFPLGYIANFPDPAGTTTGYTDAIPWVAALAKLVRFALPERSQYFGAWLGFSFGFQALLGARIAALATARPLLRLFGGALFAVAPVLLFRIAHIALCGQWVIVCAIWLALRGCGDGEGARRSTRRGGVLVLVVAGIHPYLAAMVMALLFAMIVRLWRVDRLIPARRALASAGAYLGIAGATFFVLGYFDGTVPTAGGWGIYSADLLALVNPMGRSPILPALPRGAGQYEGFAYLGAGVLALGIFAAIALALRRPGLPWKRAWPVVVAALLLALYSLSSRITIAGRVLVDLGFSFGRIAEVFQSSGRFIWPLHYVLLAGALLVTLRVLRDRPRTAALVLAAVLAVQVLEPRQLGHTLPEGGMPQPKDPAWQLARGHFHRLVLYPARLYCPGAEHPGGHAIHLGWFAYGLGLTINSAELSRVHSGRHQAYCRALEDEVASGHFAADSIYVVHPQSVARFSAHAICGRLDDLDVCVAPDASEPLRAALAAKH